MRSLALAKKTSLELKKHVALIHSTNKLTLLERKIANALLYNAYEHLLTRNEHKIHIPSLCSLIGYNSKDYKTIKKSLISLISTVLEWNLIDKEKAQDEGTWIASAMLADAKIEGSICTYSYSNRMRELCYYPEFYGRLNIQIISMFKSTYGLALYENCIRYQNISTTPWLEMPIFRKLMGVEDNKYEMFRDLNKRVIKPAVREVNNYSPIYVESEIRRNGKKVIAIRFLIKREKKAKEPYINPEIDSNLTTRLKSNYGLSDKQIENFFLEYNEAYILEKIELIESSTSYQNGKIEHLAKYLEKALKENFQPPKSSKENLEQLKIKREKEAKIRKLREMNAHKYRVYQNQYLPEIFSKLPNKEKIRIEKSFEKYINTTLYDSVYAKEGLNNPLVRDRFADFIRSNHPELLASLLSFENFCKQFSL